ncbi:MAG TPA: glycosyltransferase family 4 protein [Chloroflexota bacterium]|nr:glycosyltransferase family 4 protein [Chloroflexota bacterium]
MRVLIVSKALVLRTYRSKLHELAGLGLEIVAVIPEEWREGTTRLRLEPGDDTAYSLVVSPLRWNGHFHLHWYPELPRVIQRVAPDVVHVDEEPYNLATFLGVGAATRRRIPSLFFTWQNIQRSYPPPFSWTEAAVYRRVRTAIAGSEEAAGVLRAKGFRKPVVVTPQFGVDTAVFFPAPRAAGPFTVGFFNRLIPAKAPLLALEAFSSLPAGSCLRVVGDGPLRGALEQAILHRGLQERVRIDRRVASDQVPHLMHEIDVLVLPSLTTPRWKEQFGRVLIEAMASGVPVVGSDSGEIPTVIGDAGLVVPEGDPAALAGELRRLHDDPSLRQELAGRGRQRAVSCYDNRVIACRTLEAYELAALAT